MHRNFGITEISRNFYLKICNIWKISEFNNSEFFRNLPKFRETLLSEIFPKFFRNFSEILPKFTETDRNFANRFRVSVQTLITNPYKMVILIDTDNDKVIWSLCDFNEHEVEWWLSLTLHEMKMVYDFNVISMRWNGHFNWHWFLCNNLHLVNGHFIWHWIALGVFSPGLRGSLGKGY